MKKILGTLALLALAAATFAADTKSAAKSQKVEGYLVDVACGTDTAESSKPGFGAKHSKHCLQMPECEESGYAVLTSDNKVVKFDKASNEQAKAFIANTNREKDWKVAVNGTMNPDNTLKVDSIALQ
jgi:hypothetical protein